MEGRSRIYFKVSFQQVSEATEEYHESKSG